MEINYLIFRSSSIDSFHHPSIEPENGKSCFVVITIDPTLRMATSADDITRRSRVPFRSASQCQIKSTASKISHATRERRETTEQHAKYVGSNPADLRWSSISIAKCEFRYGRSEWWGREQRSRISSIRDRHRHALLLVSYLNHRWLITLMLCWTHCPIGTLIRFWPFILALTLLSSHLAWNCRCVFHPTHSKRRHRIKIHLRNHPFSPWICSTALISINYQRTLLLLLHLRRPTPAWVAHFTGHDRFRVSTRSDRRSNDVFLPSSSASAAILARSYQCEESWRSADSRTSCSASESIQ